MTREYVNSKGKKFIGHLVLKPNSKNALPYILVVPKELDDGKNVVLESVNYEGTNDPMRIADRVIEGLRGTVEIVDDAPIVIPFVPDVKGGRPYYQQLSRECFEGEYPIDFERVDLKVLETLKEARELIEEDYKKTTAEKVFLNGYSSSGVFAQRFAMLHPEVVDRALIGGAAGSIPIPNDTLEYPFGTKDFEELFGKEFNLEAYKKIEFAYYVAELEANKEAWEFDIEGNVVKRDEKGNQKDKSQAIAPMHDMSYLVRSTGVKQGRAQREIWGRELAERYENCIKYYEDNGYRISSKIYRGSTHGGIYSSSNPSRLGVLRDIIGFYKHHKPLEQDEYSAERISMEKQREREHLARINREI
ncbi:MAG: alpha/beta hydrolase [Clostridia bacterium]|nr:alpha/beta hydrolase [Clostridia bacterium]